MPRKPGPRRDLRSRTWIAQLGTPSPKTGRRGRVTLRNEDGTVVKYEDHAGAHAAFARLMAASEAEEKRTTGLSVAELVRAFLRSHMAGGSKPDTIEGHKFHLVKFAQFEWGGVAYGNRPAASVAVADWTRYRKAMAARGCQTGYIKLAYASVHACWNWASRPIEDREPLKLLQENPFHRLPRPKPGKGRKLVLPLGTIEALVNFAEAWVERPTEGLKRNARVAIHRQREANRLKVLALRLIAETGCRPFEMARLRWEWVYAEHRVIIIPEEHTKTGKEDRIIGFSEDVARRLAEVRDAGRSHAVWVFAPAGEERGEAPDASKLADWFKAVRAAARAEGIDLPPGSSLYTLRHSFVSQVRSGGMDLRDLAPGMGHSAEVAERIYDHAQPERIRELMDRAREARKGKG